MALPSLDRRRKLGYGLSSIKEFLNGFDNGTGYFKLPLYFLGLTATIFLAPYLLTVAFTIGLVYLIKAYVEEKENIAKELRKKALLRKLTITLYEQQEEYDHSKNHLNHPHIQAEGLNDINSEMLLYYVIRDYLNSQKPQLQKYNGKYPNQTKILKYLSHELKLPVNDPKFLSKAEDFFTKNGLHTKDGAETIAKFKTFYAHAMANEAMQVVPTIHPIRKATNATLKFIKNRKIIRRGGKIIIDTISDSSTGMGIALGVLMLFGIIIAGNPITLPILLGVIATGVAFAGISLAYNRLVAKNRKQILKQLDKEIASKEQKILYAKHLNKINRNYVNDNQTIFKAGYTNLNDEQAAQLVKNNNKYAVYKNIPLSNSYKTRAFFGLFVQGINGVALGMIIGMSVVWIATLVIGCPYLIPALIIGGVFAGFYLYSNLKQEGKKIHKEVQAITEVSELEQDVENYIGKERVHKIAYHQDNTPKSNRILLKQLIETYLDYLNDVQKPLTVQKKLVIPQPALQIEVLRKQEKILRLIEQTAKIERNDNKLGDDLFYDSLAKYLKGDNKDGDDANLLVQQLKNKIYAKSGLPSNKVNADHPNLIPTLTTKEKVKNKFKSFGDFMRNYGLPFIGAVSLGLMVPLFLAGPQALILIAIVATVVTSAFVIQKIVEKRAEKAEEQRTEKKLQLKLVERTAKLENAVNLKKVDARFRANQVPEQAPAPKVIHNDNACAQRFFALKSQHKSEENVLVMQPVPCGTEALSTRLSASPIVQVLAS